MTTHQVNAIITGTSPALVAAACASLNEADIRLVQSLDRRPVRTTEGRMALAVTATVLGARSDLDLGVVNLDAFVAAINPGH